MGKSSKNKKAKSGQTAAAPPKPAETAANGDRSNQEPESTPTGAQTGESEPEISQVPNGESESIDTSAIEPSQTPEPSTTQDQEPIEKKAASSAPTEALKSLSIDISGDLSAKDAKIAELSAKLEEVEAERDESQDQYADLLDKVGQIKSTLGQRLKSDAAELESVRLENADLRQQVETLKHQLSESQSSRGASTQQWQLAQEDLKRQAQKVASLELVIGEERLVKEALEAQLSYAQEETATQTQYAEHYKAVAETAQSDHQKALLHVQELLNKASAEKDAKNKTITALEAKLSEQSTQLDQAKQDLQSSEQQRTSGQVLEEQVKEKNIVIGKLRHEAVILNEHLTNALRMIKRDGEGSTVDKELISNLFVQYATIPRGDTKKFEVLQLISSFLGWTDDRKAQVGLIRGSSVTGSGTAGGPGDGSEPSGGFFGKFTEFLERESQRKK